MRLQCFYCLKFVSTELPDDMIFRATATCPECEETLEREGERFQQFALEGLRAELAQAQNELVLMTVNAEQERLAGMKWFDDFSALGAQVNELRTDIARKNTAIGRTLKYIDGKEPFCTQVSIVVQLQSALSPLPDSQLCGHPASEIVQSCEDTAYSGVCEREDVAPSFVFQYYTLYTLDQIEAIAGKATHNSDITHLPNHASVIGPAGEQYDFAGVDSNRLILLWIDDERRTINK